MEGGIGGGGVVVEETTGVGFWFGFGRLCGAWHGAPRDRATGDDDENEDDDNDND